MSIVKDVFFGGAEKKAAQAQESALRESQDFIREGVAAGKEDINKYFPQSQEMTAAGFQGALDTFGQFMPEQARLFQEGNTGAQQALLSGLPQMNNAILGNPIDYSAMQPQTLSYDPSMFQQQLPSGIMDAINQTSEEMAGNQSGANAQPGFNSGFAGTTDGSGRPMIGSDGGMFMGGFNSGVSPEVLNNIYGDGSQIAAASGYQVGSGGGAAPNMAGSGQNLGMLSGVGGLTQVQPNSLIGGNPLFNNSGRLF